MSSLLSTRVVRKIIFSLAFLAISGAPAYAAADTKPAVHPKRLNQDLALTRAEMSILETRAQAGDNQAAIRLAHYFDFYAHDYNSAKYWLEKAARNGDVSSQYSMGVRLMTQRKDSERCGEAQFWFNMALENGLSKAKAALKELGQCP